MFKTTELVNQTSEIVAILRVRTLLLHRGFVLYNNVCYTSPTPTVDDRSSERYSRYALGSTPSAQDDELDIAWSGGICLDNHIPKLGLSPRQTTRSSPSLWMNSIVTTQDHL